VPHSFERERKGLIDNRVGSEPPSKLGLLKTTKARRKGGENMKIVGCDLHTRYQQIAMLEEETGELVERRLEHGAHPQLERIQIGTLSSGTMN
jgi:hypothetical protein